MKNVFEKTVFAKMTFFVIFGEICPKRVLIHFRRFEKCQKWSFLMKKGRKSAKKRQNDGFGTFEKVRGNDWGAHFVEKWVRNTTFWKNSCRIEHLEHFPTFEVKNDPKSTPSDPHFWPLFWGPSGGLFQKRASLDTLWGATLSKPLPKRAQKGPFWGPN